MSDDESGLPFDVPRDEAEGPTLELTVEADTEAFVEQIERATEAIEEFRAACDLLDEPPVRVEILSHGGVSHTKIAPAGTDDDRNLFETED